MMTHRLLIVDDEPRRLRSLEMTFSDEGYEVMTARNGREALLRLAETLPDLIISDIRMPGLYGYQLAERLRANPRTELVPLICLTAKDKSADRIAGFRSGVDAYLTKPFEAEELLAVAASIISRVRRTHAAIATQAGPSLPAAQNEASDAREKLDEQLTEAEERAAQMVARGLSNKEIALQQGVSVRTVETHISHILVKKGFNNRVEIARFVMERTRSETPAQV